MTAVGFVGLFFARSPIFPTGTVWWLVQKELFLVLLALGVKQLPLAMDTRFLIFAIVLALGMALSWVAGKAGLGVGGGTSPTP
jgi:hypothetical protein